MSFILFFLFRTFITSRTWTTHLSEPSGYPASYFLSECPKLFVEFYQNQHNRVDLKLSWLSNRTHKIYVVVYANRCKYVYAGSRNDYFYLIFQNRVMLSMNFFVGFVFLLAFLNLNDLNVAWYGSYGRLVAHIVLIHFLPSKSEELEWPMHHVLQ